MRQIVWLSKGLLKSVMWDYLLREDHGIIQR